ncbi:DUF3742 family protein [Collimonas silvisoli]|uniref:DUF3742 family protein n=1 Tax=Collimonas silvisoli TaxID=2825884 RepID=UPI001B8B7748|nr:DUF3742 family protein [Collimonas silvisoli]
MQETKTMTFAERAGRTVGRWLKPIARLESAVWRRFATAGAPHWLVLTLKWGVSLALLLGLLYLSVVPALIVLFLVLLGGGTGVMDDEEFQESFNFHYNLDQEEEERKAREDEEEQLRLEDEWWG